MTHDELSERFRERLSDEKWQKAIAEAIDEFMRSCQGTEFFEVIPDQLTQDMVETIAQYVSVATPATSFLTMFVLGAWLHSKGYVKLPNALQ